MKNEPDKNEMSAEDSENEYVTAVDEDGNEILLEPVDYFYYNGDEYALLTEVSTDNDADDDDAYIDDDIEGEAGDGALGCFVCKVNRVKDENGEEMDDFEPVDDEELAEKLIEIANTRQNEEEG